MNKSDILKALEWVDQTARDGDVHLLAKAKLALEAEIASVKTTGAPKEAYRVAVESFVRKFGREPLEEIVPEE
jgi:hypothetical protein